MSSRQISIAVDAMGGENSPLKVLKGIELFKNEFQNAELKLFGEKELIISTIKKHNIKINSLEIINTTDNVKDDDNPNTILRSRKDSSMFKGLEFVKNNSNSGFVSAGNTAAIMILSRLLIGMIKGVDRPAICSLIPNKKNFSIMLDLGANVTVNASNLLQFALMGYCYFNLLNKNKKPRMGILNIGTENNKGLEFLQEAADLISSSFLNKYYVGFIEPNKIALGECDIIISDGYTGNIMLKSAEGISDFITTNLKEMFNKKIVNKIAYKIIEKDLIDFRQRINPEIYNGALLIGLNGISIKSHGNASSVGFSHALKQCYNSISDNLNEQITDYMQSL